MKRTAIREQTFRLLYSLEIQKTDNIEEQIELYLECNEIENEKAITTIQPESNDLTGINNILARRTYDESGNYKVYGLEVSARSTSLYPSEK